MSKFCSLCGKPVKPSASFCTACGAPIREKTTPNTDGQNKRDRVLSKSNPHGRNHRRTIIAVLIVAAFAGWVYSNLPDKGNPIIKASPVVAAPANYGQAGKQMIDVPSKVENGRIIIPLDLLKERKYIAFTYTTKQNIVPLLAYITGEGKIVTAVSMCEPCNSQRFHIRGEEVVCNACGSTWKLDNLEAVSGSCSKYPPDVVPNVVVDNQIQIDEQIVARWQRRI